MSPRFFIATLLFGGFVANMNIVALVPYLSPIASDIESSVALVGQAQMAGLIVGAVMGLFVTQLSAHYRLRRLLIFGTDSLDFRSFFSGCRELPADPRTFGLLSATVVLGTSRHPGV